MDMIKKLFPFSFKNFDSIKKLALSIVFYILLGLACGLAGALIVLIPLIGGLVATLIGVVSNTYAIAGILLAILKYFHIMD